MLDEIGLTQRGLSVAFDPASPNWMRTILAVDADGRPTRRLQVSEAIWIAERLRVDLVDLLTHGLGYAVPRRTVTLAWRAGRIGALEAMVLPHDDLVPPDATPTYVGIVVSPDVPHPYAGHVIYYDAAAPTVVTSAAASVCRLAGGALILGTVTADGARSQRVVSVTGEVFVGVRVETVWPILWTRTQ